MNNRWNRRKTMVLWLVIAVVFLAAVCIGGLFCEDAARATDFSRKNIAPCLKYPFGTDWLGRDMFARTVRGLSISIIIGVCAATFSAVMAFILGVVSETMGKTADTIVTHMAPHLLPQFIVGLVLLFPHAILHESGITFLGFGLSNEQPAIGIILSEAMKYLITGKWWLALFPGIMLVITVVCFYTTGENLRRLLDPASAHE